MGVAVRGLLIEAMVPLSVIENVDGADETTEIDNISFFIFRIERRRNQHKLRELL